MTSLNYDVKRLFQLTGRRALITGGSQGLGKVIAETLAQAGAEVIIVSRHQDKCDGVAREIADACNVATYAIAADVTQREAVDNLFERAKSVAGDVDILINSAGLNIRGPVESLSEEDWDAVLNINLKAPFLLARRFGPEMAKRGWEPGNALTTLESNEEGRGEPR